MTSIEQKIHLLKWIQPEAISNLKSAISTLKITKSTIHELKIEVEKAATNDEDIDYKSIHEAIAVAEVVQDALEEKLRIKL